MRWNLIALLLMLSVAPVFMACARAATLSSPALEGKVIEQQTQEPIAGVLVVVLWRGTIGTIGHGSTVCHHVETATTDAQGNYRIPAWQKPSPYGDIAHRHPEPTAYKPGFVFLRSDKATIYIKPFIGSRGERLEYLKRTEQSYRPCQSPEAGERNLLPLYRALYAEANSVAVTKEDREIADDFLAGIETIELGYHEGLRRAIKRAEERRQQP
jgi:hypothetical protein